MDKMIKGTLLSEYARMIKSKKDVDWGEHLIKEDMELVRGMIIPSSWYPLEVYKRMGLAVFQVIAQGDVKLAWLWGRTSIEEQSQVYRNLVLENDPVGTINRFFDFRSRFLSFDMLEIEEPGPAHVHIIFKLKFGDDADVAYGYQFGGILERMMELSGAKEVTVDFHKKSWEGDPNTVYDIKWE